MKEKRIPSGAIPAPEQETVIVIDCQTRKANIYSTDTRFINKLDKRYERTKEHFNENGICAVEYEIPENLISFRSPTTKRTMTEEQKKAASERVNYRRFYKRRLVSRRSIGANDESLPKTAYIIGWLTAPALSRSLLRDSYSFVSRMVVA